MRCPIVAGAANNQLADDGVADMLRRAASYGRPTSSSTRVV